MEKLDTFVPLNIATGVPCSIKQALDAILQVDEYPDANIVFNSSKPTMIPKRLIDTTKAKQLLDFEAKTSIIEGVKKTVDWYRQKTLRKSKNIINQNILRAFRKNQRTYQHIFDKSCRTDSLATNIFILFCLITLQIFQIEWQKLPVLSAKSPLNVDFSAGMGFAM